jgi:hypothetical protein
MLIEARENLAQTDGEKLLEVADFLCHKTPVVRPIFECVKVFIRLHESGKFTYARHSSDLDIPMTSAYDMSSRMKSLERRLAVKEALEEVETRCQDTWPFSPGSSSWVLLEILHPEIKIIAAENKPAIIFRKAVRLNSQGEQTTTPLLERMFNSFKLTSTGKGTFQFFIDPVIKLSNISGTGIFTEFRKQAEDALHLTDGKLSPAAKPPRFFSEEAVSDFIDGLLESNFELPLCANPGFYFRFENTIYQIRSGKFRSSKKGKKLSQAPLSVFGFIR